MIILDEEKHGIGPEFQALCTPTVEKVIPRLLESLQSGGHSVKPCLIQGNLWDENTETDMDTGEHFVFDAGSFYAHKEYAIGNWRAKKYRWSKRAYERNYKKNFPVSESGESTASAGLVELQREELIRKMQWMSGTTVTGCIHCGLT